MQTNVKVYLSVFFQELEVKNTVLHFMVDVPVFVW